MQSYFTVALRRRGFLFAAALGVLLASAAGAEGQSDSSRATSGAAASSAQPNGQTNILDMDVEQLAKVDVKVPSMDVEVTSVSKQESTVGHSPAAVFVITNEMIRRSGVTSIPEALRMAPGVEVARIDSHCWAITIRGFNGWFANKLLILIDGREVYNQLFAGVYWDVQDVPLEDIDRIEVIRGPAGTIWGDNAVNGVINVITKKAQDTQGALVAVGGGNLDKAINVVRVGGNNGDGLSWRVYGKHFERGTEYNPTGPAYDDWRMGRGGFRMDWELNRHKSDTLTVQGDYYGGQEGQQFQNPLFFPPYTEILTEDEAVSGANVLARYTHVIDDESDWSLQTYFDRTFRELTIFTQQINTFDVEFQHRFPLGDRHHFIWGLRNRQIHDYLPSRTYEISFDPMEWTTNLFSGFVQDEIELVDDTWFFTIGSKFEHNSFTGFEYQPSVRLLYAIDKRHAAWAAISRAVRTPARYEENGTINLGPWYSPYYPGIAIFGRIYGTDTFLAEDVLAYEIGYREQTTEQFSWDVAAFFNSYHHLQSGFMDNMFPEWENPEHTAYHFVAPAWQRNEGRAQTYGVEATAQWSVSKTWRLSGSYSFLKIIMPPLPQPWRNSDFEDPEGKSPLNQARFYSSWDLGKSWDFDLGLRYVDNLTVDHVPAYITLDARLGWRPRKNLELALVGTNLLDDHHPEFGTENLQYMPTYEVRRTIYASMTWRR